MEKENIDITCKKGSNNLRALEVENREYSGKITESLV